MLDWFAPIANCHSHNFDSLLAIGLFAMILFQVMVNIGMTIGLLEVTGMPLPLVRYGRSALLSTYLGLGMVLSIANHRPRSRY
ncbi:FtsW/RodA/SpoVE family cell cycle protein [uncultured Thermosynechococcus sp.]|uniref:FtsW/RodA/SpoVE family cell cycle protein n=1 Tax=uncultured Thermosynechococcus sp. TaxID=436945 RepID=UPI00261CC159|nr:FtsW/RodA/SpoVE family cell cycle protein [uncultured Thermosynechococcus sp.]